MIRDRSFITTTVEKQNVKRVIYGKRTTKAEEPITPNTFYEVNLAQYILDSGWVASSAEQLAAASKHAAGM